MTRGRWSFQAIGEVDQWPGVAEVAFLSSQETCVGTKSARSGFVFIGWR